MIPRFSLAALLLLSAVVVARAQVDSARTPTPLLPLVLEGRVDELTDGVATGQWEGQPEGDVARALLLQDGLDAASAFRDLVVREDLDPRLRTLAWFHLYGYARLVDNRGQVNAALGELNKDNDLAKRLFHSGIPAPMKPKPSPESAVYKVSHSSTPAASGAYAIQIGAFGARSNAQRLAKHQEKKGYTVEVKPLKSGGRTLYAVWVGRFPSERDASAFGRKVYGKEGKDFRVVKW